MCAQDGAPTPDQIRKGIANQIELFNIMPVEVDQVLNTSVQRGTDSIAVRVYIPKATEKPMRIIYNIHGGALIAGDLNTHDNISRLLASGTNSIVVALDYRRPPESPYPAGLDDCITVLQWIIQQAPSWKADASDIVLLGDSGGGLLAASLLVKTQKQFPIKKAVFINPAVDLRTPGEGLYGMVTQMYLNGRSANDSIISPITATNFSSFPPSLIVTCSDDELKPHGIILDEKIRAAGGMSKIVELPKEDHLGGLWSAGHPRAQQAIDATVEFISGK